MSDGFPEEREVRAFVRAFFAAHALRAGGDVYDLMLHEAPKLLGMDSEKLFRASGAGASDRIFDFARLFIHVLDQEYYVSLRGPVGPAHRQERYRMQQNLLNGIDAFFKWSSWDPGAYMAMRDSVFHRR